EDLARRAVMGAEIARNHDGRPRFKTVGGRGKRKEQSSGGRKKAGKGMAERAHVADISCLSWAPANRRLSAAEFGKQLDVGRPNELVERAHPQQAIAAFGQCPGIAGKAGGI